MRLLAAGFNGRGQLSSTSRLNIPEFLEVARVEGGMTIEVCWAGWSDVVIRTGICYHWRGHQGCVVSLGTGCERGTPRAPYLHSFFGTHDGCRGAVNTDYSLSLISIESTEDQALNDVKIINPDSFSAKQLLTNVAVTGTGITIATMRILDDTVRGANSAWAFKYLEEFLHVARPIYSRCARPKRPFDSSSIQNKPIEALHTGQTFCIAQTASSLHSWGWDARYDSSLGRPTGESHPSTVPSPVVGFSSEDGFNIKKVATCPGGHLAAVLTGDGTVYIWGSCGPKFPLNCNIPGDDSHCLGIFTRAEADGWIPSDGPLPIEIDGLPDEDFIDIGVGVSHVVLVERKRGVWVAGDNAMGQLGLGLDPRNGSKFLTDFRKVNLGPDEKHIKGVTCGWYSTFLLLEDEQRSR